MNRPDLKILIVIFAILCSGYSFSQSKKQNSIESIDPVVINIPASVENTSALYDRELEKNINEQRKLGNKSIVRNLQNELIEKYNIKTDESEIKQTEPVKGNFFNTVQSDATNRTNITLIDSTTYISVQGAISEQIGNNMGRLWNVYIVENISNVKDTIKFVYSDDNGLNWNLFAAYIWNYENFETIASMMDLEIIINPSTNDKVLYAVFTCNNNTDWRTGIVRVDVGNHPGLCTQQLFNYGSFTFSHRFQYARVTTDNANYPNAAYIFLCAYEYYFNAFFNDYIYVLKYAVIMNPFDLNSPISYSDGRIFTFAGTPTRTYDFCSFNIGFNDYVLFTDASYSTSEKTITVLQYNIYDALAGGSGTTASLGNNINKVSYPTVASDGTNIVVAAEFVYSSSDVDIQYFKSSNGILAFNTSGMIDNSTLYETKPSVISKWNSGGKFSCAYSKSNLFSSYESIYLSNSGSSLFDSRSKMISNNDISTFILLGFIFPLPTRNDECFVTWIDGGPIQELYSATGCSENIQITKEMSLKLFFEGFYRPSTNQMVMHDTIKVYLRNYTSPYNIVDSARGPVSKSGTASLNFGNAQSGIKYFVAVKHRNSIETWSKPDGVIFLGDYLNFDFSLSNGQSYGANQTQVDQTPIIYAFFSGDVNQDGVVDATDAGTVDNEAYNFSTGYLVSDLTGDNVTDASDAAIVDNNAYNFVSAIRP